VGQVVDVATKQFETMLDATLALLATTL
jgi:hypothetical protein